MREQARDDQDALEVIVFTMAAPDLTATFLDDFWPEARAVSDPEQRIYRAFRLRRGNPWQLFGPGVWAAGWRAWRKKQRIGKPVGDPLQMPGWFVVEKDRVLAQHVSRHAGDHPDLTALRERAAARRAERTL